MGNEERILNFVRRYGPVSKAEISRRTAITAPTVTNVCNNLVKQRLIQTVGRDYNAIGRPSLLMDFCERYEYYLIVHVRTQKIHFYITNAGARIIDFYKVSTIGKTGDEILSMIQEGIGTYIAEKEFPIKAIGLVLRGPVDTERGISLFSPHGKWRNVPFHYILEEKYHLPVYLENDMFALTTGEYFYGMGQYVKDLYVLKLSYGIGATMMIDGSLYRGYRNRAGELGHIMVRNEEGILIPLEEVASENAMRRYLLEAIEGGAKTDLVHNKLIMERDFRIEPLYRAAAIGDEVALGAIKKAMEYLGIALANSINMLNPEKIIISSDFYGAETIVDPILKEAIDEYSYRVHPIEISYSSKGYEKILQGMIDIICTKRAGFIWLA